ncbi:MAG: hypothetical protein LBT62_00085, partial [Deltaproteobacteria bacterium]|nr:hypothetical protein [Deltaproteobacteria bacterium]
MPIEPGTPISQLYDNFRHLIEEFSEIGFSLYGHYQNSSKSEVDQSNEIHKLKAKIAVTNLSIRDTVEALSKHPDFKAPAPDGFDATLLRMVAAYDIQKMTVVGKGYFDSLKKILDLSRSSWFIAEATDILIMRNLEQNQDDQAVALYFELLEQAQLYEDAIPSLTRCAFYLTSKFALMGELEPARKVYDTMVRFGGSKASLSVVKKTGKAKGPAAADGRTQRPFLQLVSNKQLKDKSTWDDLGPRESERFDSEDIALIRAQA